MMPLYKQTVTLFVRTRMSDLCQPAFRLASLPEKPNTIDWGHYRKTIAKAGMVDEFEKKVRSVWP